MEASPPTHWGIIGTGSISTDFCLALRTLSPQQHQLVAVAARDLANAEKFAQRHGIPRAYNSYESVAKDAEVDVVYIGTVNSNHVSLSLMALAAGKHVLCEKPMSLTAKNARKVFEFAQEKKLLFVEAFWSRFFPAYKQLRHELASGSIGEIKGVNASFGLKFNWETNERLQKKELGGGVTKDIGCYPVQLSCLVFGNERPEKIYVQGSLLTTGVDRCAHVMLCYKDGRTAQLTVTGDSLLPNKALIYGTNGVIEIGHPFWCPLTLTTPTKTYEYDLPKTPEPTIFRNSAGLIYEIQAVRQAILEGKSQVSEISHEDSLLIAEIQDEILQQLGVSFAESTV